MHESFVDEFVRRTRALRVGDGIGRSEIGPLVSEAARARVRALVDGALEAGATLACGGGVPADCPPGWFFEPTVLLDVTPAMEIMQVECFGPVASGMAENAARMPAQQSHEIHFAIGEGTRDGQPIRVRHEVRVGPDPAYDGYVDAATSMNASIAAQLLLDSKRRPGVWAPEEYFDATAYFREAGRRGMHVVRSVERRDAS